VNEGLHLKQAAKAYPSLSPPTRASVLSGHAIISSRIQIFPGDTLITVHEPGCYPRTNPNANKKGIIILPSLLWRIMAHADPGRNPGATFSRYSCRFDFEPSVFRHIVPFRNHRARIASINDMINLILFPSSIYTPNDALYFPSDFFVVLSTLTIPYSFVNNFYYSTYMPVIRSYFARPSAVSAKWAKPGGVLSQHQGLVCVGWFSAIPPQSPVSQELRVI
jgi:hypothetical protein